MTLKGFDLQATTANRDIIRAITKATLAILSLVFLTYLVRLLPGADLLIPSTPLSIASVFGAIVTILLVGLVLLIAPKAATLTRIGLSGPSSVVENIAGVVYWLLVLVAIIIAHRGLAGIFLPVFGGLSWLYDVIFLVIALPVVVFIAARLYANLDPGTDHVMSQIIR